MDINTLNALEEALKASPGNNILRKQIAQGFFQLGEFERAKEHLNILLQNEPNSYEIKAALAKCFASLGNTDAAMIIIEEIIQVSLQPDIMSLYIELLIKDGQMEDAIAKYQSFQMQAKGYVDENLEKQLKISPIAVDEDWDESEDSIFLEQPDIDFSKVGGMGHIKEEIRIKIIQPIQNPDLFKAFGKKAGGGILMYGPPGCGKTYMAKATAGEINSKFLSIGIEEVMDMWVGNSEKNLHHKFEIARANHPCVMFFDEIDALGSKRNDLKQSASRNLINQLLKEMDGINSDNEGVLILGATNSPWHMDTAFLRPGRFDRIIFVPPPDKEARAQIVSLLLEGKPVQSIHAEKVASKTDGFSGADLQSLIDHAVEDKLRQSMSSGKIEKIDTNDILRNVKKVRPSTKEWFNTARNYALYSNSSGIYDDILSYLKL